MTFKLPRPFPYQLGYHSLAMRCRFNSIAGGRRSGKSHYALTWLLVMGMMGGTKGINVWLSPTIKQARNVGMGGFIGHLGSLDTGLYETKRGELSVTIAGRTYFFTSTDNADSVRGWPIWSVVMDEAAFQKEYAWTEVVRPALADLKGHALMASTYKGYNWYYDLMQDEHWNRTTWPTAMNPLIDAEEIDLLRETMDEQAFKQEIEAKPTTAKGLVFEKVFGADNLARDCGPREGDTVAISMDFGYSDPCVISFYSYHRKSPASFDILKFDELEFRGVLLEEIVPQIIKRLTEWNVEAVNLMCAVDIAGLQHTGVSEWSYIDRLKNFNIFNVVYKKVSKESAINFMRAQFLNAMGDRNFRVCDRCKLSKKSYIGYEIKNAERPFDDSKHDHFPDSDTYFFENLIRPYVRGKEMVSRVEEKHGEAKMVKCGGCRKRFVTFTGAQYCAECKRKLIMEGVA